MASQRIRDTCTEFNSRCVERHRRHVDVGLAPDEVRVADPDMTVARRFRYLGKVNHFL